MGKRRENGTAHAKGLPAAPFTVWRKHCGETGSKEPAAWLSPPDPRLMAANCRKTSR